MKKWVILLFTCCLMGIHPFGTNNFSQTNISPQFSELKGMEDQLGNTHLLYRIYTNYENPPVYDWSNHIFHFELETGIDTLYINSSGHEDPIYNFSKWVSDVDYWNHNPAEFIFSGGYSMGPYFEGSAFVERFDGYYNTIDYFWGSAEYIDISPINDSVLYLGVNAYGGFQTLSSSDGGRSWDTLNLDYQFLSLNPNFENIYFVENEDRELFRTTDSGNTFNLVDPEFIVDSRFFYDFDGQHIYRKTNNKLIISDNLGEQFSWQTKYSSDSEIFISADESVSGTIYLADKKNIFVSTDYGSNFSLYKTLNRKIVGIYKKPNTNKLYAATEYCIYEITSDTIIILKQLPAINDLQWYPLAVGNKWVYNNYREEFNPPGLKEFIGVSTMEVLGDTMLSNQKRYYQLKNEPLYWEIDSGFVRPDSLEGKLYLFLPGENREVLYEDFSVQVGDTIWIDSTEYKTLISEEYFTLWGMGTYKRTYDYNYRFEGYELVKNIGMYYFGFSDFFALYSSELKGCIIDGVVYGDTTTVDVEDEVTPNANNFKLEQNYPNPFNPTTKIRFRIADFGFVTLKIYDVLGNEIATLVNEEKSTGTYEVEFNTSSIKHHPSSGIYFYQLKAGSFIQTKKMVYLK